MLGTVVNLMNVVFLDGRRYLVVQPGTMDPAIINESAKWKSVILPQTPATWLWSWPGMLSVWSLYVLPMSLLVFVRCSFFPPYSQRWTNEFNGYCKLFPSIGWSKRIKRELMAIWVAKIHKGGMGIRIALLTTGVVEGSLSNGFKFEILS